MVNQTENQSKTQYECKRCGDPHFNNDSVNCSECGYTEEEIHQQKIDNIMERFHEAFDAMNTDLDDIGEMKVSMNHFIDFIVDKGMEFYNQREMSELVKYIALNISGCDP